MSIAKLRAIAAVRETPKPREEMTTVLKLSMSGDRYHEAIVREVNYRRSFIKAELTGTLAGKLLYLEAQRLKIGGMSYSEMDTIKDGDTLQITILRARSKNCFLRYRIGREAI